MFTEQLNFTNFEGCHALARRVFSGQGPLLWPRGLLADLRADRRNQDLMLSDCLISREGVRGIYRVSAGDRQLSGARPLSYLQGRLNHAR